MGKLGTWQVLCEVRIQKHGKKLEIIRFVAVARPTNYTKMSPAKFGQKQRMKKETKKQCHTCQSCRRMTQMLLGLLTSLHVPPDPSLDSDPQRTWTSLDRRRHHQRFVCCLADSESCQPQNTNQVQVQKPAIRISWKFHN